MSYTFINDWLALCTLYSSSNINEDDKIKLTYTTNFGSEELSTSSYTQFTKERHLDCIKLFDGCCLYALEVFDGYDT